MNRREALLVGMAALGLLVPAGLAQQTAAKEATVTLTVSGMT